MDERRATMRERVIYGATANVGSGRSRPCVIRNFSDNGAYVQFGTATPIPDDIALTVARKGRSYQARIVWWRDNAAGVVFAHNTSAIAPLTDLEERLRVSEKKTRQLKRRVSELMGN